MQYHRNQKSDDRSLAQISEMYMSVGCCVTDDRGANIK